MTVLVTGAAGYIGSHIAHELVDDGRDVVVLDNLSTGVRENVPEAASFVHGDAGDFELVTALLAEHDVEAVMHFAGSIVVPESVEAPLKYYSNNTAVTRTLLAACVAQGVDKFVFSSTAAVYGMPSSDELPVTEETPTAPINPYGSSKLMTEWMLRDVAHAHDFRYVALRYFNVAGADPKGRTGQSTPQATHLIKVASEAALGKRERLAIFGTDYETRDGTCIRDYIHVTDLARVHILALEALESGEDSRVLNCGYGHGYTVREVIEAVKRVSEVDFEVADAARRAGDPPELIADSTKLREQFGWQPQHDEIDEIVRTALAWEKKA
ncbi:MAG: UDP-glucose 4-epimerase GalE [Persicimonas sp.]